MTTETHAHRWRIDEPHGRTSHAVCACGAERDMKNAHFEDRDLGAGYRKIAVKGGKK